MVVPWIAGEVAIPSLFSNQIRISGISIGRRADQEDMIRAITVNRLKPVIDRRFPLWEIVAASNITIHKSMLARFASNFKISLVDGRMAQSVRSCLEDR